MALQDPVQGVHVFLAQFDEQPPTPQQLDAWAAAFARTTNAALT